MEQKSTKPDTSWDWVRSSLVFLLVATVLGITTITAGFFDPKPLGRHISHFTLSSHEIASRSLQIWWLDIPKSKNSMTLRLTAKLQDGELDSGYGIALGGQAASLIVAVSPVGYLSVYELNKINGDFEIARQFIPWQTWPHVNKKTEQNEIWVDIEGGYATSIRVNRELLWQGNILLPADDIGLYGESFGESATFAYIALEQFSEQE